MYISTVSLNSSFHNKGHALYFNTVYLGIHKANGLSWPAPFEKLANLSVRWMPGHGELSVKASGLEIASPLSSVIHCCGGMRQELIFFSCSVGGRPSGLGGFSSL